MVSAPESNISQHYTPRSTLDLKVLLLVQKTNAKGLEHSTQKKKHLNFFYFVGLPHSFNFLLFVWFPIESVLSWSRICVCVFFLNFVSLHYKRNQRCVTSNIISSLLLDTRACTHIHTPQRTRICKCCNVETQYTL